MDSPADFILRWDIIGGGVHLCDDYVGVVGQLHRKRDTRLARLRSLYPIQAPPTAALTFSPSSLYLGSRFLQCPHQGA